MVTGNQKAVKEDVPNLIVPVWRDRILIKRRDDPNGPIEFFSVMTHNIPIFDDPTRLAQREIHQEIRMSVDLEALSLLGSLGINGGVTYIWQLTLPEDSVGTEFGHQVRVDYRSDPSSTFCTEIKDAEFIPIQISDLPSAGKTYVERSILDLVLGRRLAEQLIGPMPPPYINTD